MSRIGSVEELRQLYGQASEMIRNKAFSVIDDHSARFIEMSPFFCIGSGQAAGDVSPRGGEAGFVHVLDAGRIAFPDRPGNNRLDTLENLILNPAVGLLFFLPGVSEMLRLNGTASIRTDDDLMERFTINAHRPRSVIVIEVSEVYFHCSKAIKRSELWNSENHVPKGGFPTLGQIARDQFKLAVPAEVIDFGLDQDARDNLY